MVSALPSSNIYSHPDRFLEKHLVGTSFIAQRNLDEKHIDSMVGINFETLKELIKICCLCHDLGKATKFFQEYLFASEEEQKKRKNEKETRHSLFSAVIAYYAVKEELLGFSGEEKAILPFLAYLAVKRHHGNLRYVLEEAILTDEEIDVLKKQLHSIDEEALRIINEYLLKEGFKIKFDKQLLNSFIDNIQNELKTCKRFLRRLEDVQSAEYYLLCNFIFSVLIDADKSDVVIRDVLRRPDHKLSNRLVDNYKASLNFEKNAMNDLRESAYKEILSRPIDINQKILSINLPTGMGKTFISLALALRLREQVEKFWGIRPRIVYSLPFISIIDQNARLFEDVFKKAGFSLDTNLILKHHHLAEVYYKCDDEELETDEAKFLMEGWNSEIIVTTFVQFFHTLLSNKNSSLRKFHRLSNSIIILDEVQAVPPKYWVLIRKILKELTEKFNSYVIFVTATEPLIFDRKEIISLVDREKYFKKLNRIEVRPLIKEKMNLEEFVDCLEIKENKSYLFVMNTINSAKKMYDLLKLKVNDEIAFLSTHVTPFERLERIREIKNGKYRFAVTTQLVEAGVDIDFDVVYRDMAPLDSINQAAGRCNRNWYKKGEFNIVYLKDENNRSYASYIYDYLLIDITERILKNYDYISESQFLDLINRYYKEISEKDSFDESEELIRSVYELRYERDDMTSISHFKIIDEDHPKIDVFVEINNQAQEIWNKYLSIKEIKNLFARKEAFEKIKADFYKFVISIPVNVKNIPPDVAGFRLVNYNSLNEFYDPVTGFNCKGVVAIW